MVRPSDSRYAEAVEIVIKEGKTSPALLQRILSIGYARASSLTDSLEENGIIGPPNGPKPREVLENNNFDE